MSDDVIVICGPLWTAVVQGSKIYKCAECGTEVACSPVGQKQVDAGAKPYCAPCGVKHIKRLEAAGEKTEYLDPTEALLKAAEFINSKGKN